MNFTQNEKLNQVTADTLIVGVDIGSQHILPELLIGEAWSWEKEFLSLVILELDF